MNQVILQSVDIVERCKAAIVVIRLREAAFLNEHMLKPSPLLACFDFILGYLDLRVTEPSSGFF